MLMNRVHHSITFAYCFGRMVLALFFFCLYLDFNIVQKLSLTNMQRKKFHLHSQLTKTFSMNNRTEPHNKSIRKTFICYASVMNKHPLCIYSWIFFYANIKRKKKKNWKIQMKKTVAKTRIKRKHITIMYHEAWLCILELCACEHYDRDFLMMVLYISHHQHFYNSHKKKKIK